MIRHRASRYTFGDAPMQHDMPDKTDEPQPDRDQPRNKTEDDPTDQGTHGEQDQPRETPTRLRTEDDGDDLVPSGR
jgi:hypothetical protein